MNKPKHTPGKWKVGAETQELICNGKLTRRYIPIYEADVNHPHWAANEPTDHPHPIIAGIHIGDEDEATANANLIASCPVMLEALKLAVILIEQGTYSYSSGVESLDLIKNAIKKAEGEL